MRMSVESPAQLGLATRLLREDKALTQRQLAHDVGTSQRWLSELESGKDVVALERTFALLKHLGASVSIEWDAQASDRLLRLMLASVDSSSDLEGRGVPKGYKGSHAVRSLIDDLLQSS